jgi:hypothetical protein
MEDFEQQKVREDNAETGKQIALSFDLARYLISLTICYTTKATINSSFVPFEVCCCISIYIPWAIRGIK